jgi:hypothetical protein
MMVQLEHDKRLERFRHTIHLTTTTWNGYALQEQEIGRQLEEALAFMQPSWAMFLDLMMVPNET